MAIESPERAEAVPNPTRQDPEGSRGLLIAMAILVAVALAVGGYFAYRTWRTDQWYAANLKVGLVVHPVNDVGGVRLPQWASAGLGPVYASTYDGRLVEVSPSGKAVSHQLIAGGKSLSTELPVATAVGLGDGLLIARPAETNASGLPSITAVRPIADVVTLGSGTLLPARWRRVLGVGIGPFGSKFALVLGSPVNGSVGSDSSLAVLRLDTTGTWKPIWVGTGTEATYRSMAVQPGTGDVYLYHLQANASPTAIHASIDLLQSTGTMHKNWATVDVFTNDPFVVSSEGSVYIAGMGPARSNFPLGAHTADKAKALWPTLIRIDPSGHQTYWLLVDSKGAPVENYSVQLGPTGRTLYVDAASSTHLVGGGLYFRLSTVKIPFDWRTGN